jgi:ubiquinol-cytochrome c reductase cytochrome b subunit
VSIRELSLIVDWLRGQYYRADDKAPILSHHEDEAERAVRLARTIENPWTAVVGAAPAKPETNQQKAERLFAANCAACHSHTDQAGAGIAAKVPSAPNLYGFGSREWLSGLLNPAQIKGDRYFGKTKHAEADMVQFVNDNLAKLDDDGKAMLQSLIAALSAEAALPSQAEADKKAEADGTLAKGRGAFAESFDSSSCVDCHKIRDQGDLGSAPDLTGWGSRDWLVRFISDPAHGAFYRATNDRMPAFGQATTGTKQALLTAEEIDLLARWLRKENLDRGQP